MNREKEIITTSVIGVIGNVLLVIGKIIIGLLAASISIITDAVNNLTDAMSSIVTVVGTKLSDKRPDKKHPFGYGRIEFITSSIIGMFIVAAGVMAIYESVNSLIKGESPTYSLYSFIIIVLAIIVKIVLGLFFKNRGNRVNSDALKASGTDALLDSILSLGTLVGAIISFFFGVHLEGYIGIAIGLFIIRTSFEVFRESISKIIGTRADAEFVSAMTDDIMKNEHVYGVYDLILNNYGTDRYIGSVHIEVDDDMTAKEIQFLEREIAYVCYDKYHTIMTVGVYAKNVENEFSRTVKESIIKAIAHHPEIIQTHGFYVNEEKKIISIDIIISFDCKDIEKLYEHVNSEITKLYPDYTVHIILDKDYSVS